MVAIISLCCSFFTIGKGGVENFLTFGKENKMAGISTLQKLKLITKFSPVFVLTTFFRAGCICTASIAAGVGNDGYGVNAGFYGASFSFPLIISVPIAILVLLKCFLTEMTLVDLVHGVLGETFTITVWNSSGREASARLQLAMAVYFLA